MSGYVYIIASKRNGTLYTGVTSDLENRVYEHKNEIHKGFTVRYGCKTLVYFELLENIVLAIKREKAIKKYGRRRKLALIEGMNPDWADLSERIYG